VSQQAADLVERVVPVPAAAELLLLDTAADLVDDLGAELHDVEGVEDRHGTSVPSKPVQRPCVAAGSFDSSCVAAGSFDTS
jgi:hypothetical protein